MSLQMRTTRSSQASEFVRTVVAYCWILKELPIRQRVTYRQQPGRFPKRVGKTPQAIEAHEQSDGSELRRGRCLNTDSEGCERLGEFSYLSENVAPLQMNESQQSSIIWLQPTENAVELSDSLKRSAIVAEPHCIVKEVSQHFLVVTPSLQRPRPRYS